MMSRQTFRQPARRRVSFLLTLAVVMAATLYTAAPAFAHCPPSDGDEHLYVAGGNSNNTVRAVSTRMEWVNSPNVCSSGVSHSISIVNYNHSATAWVQAGWRYYAWYARPMGYCERMPAPDGTGSYAITEYSVSQTEQRYTYARGHGDNQFECRIGGETLRISHVDWLGFSAGTWVPVQAEAHAPHLQLGRVSPNWFDFSGTEKGLYGETGWSQMNINGLHTDRAVWNFRQPNNDGFRVNTDADH